MREDFILSAVDHVFSGQREDIWPDHVAGVVGEGIGVIITYSNDRFQVATIVLTDLQISTELLEGIWEANNKLPISSVFLSSVETGWCAIWKYKVFNNWLDPGSQGTRDMMVDILANAPNMTQMAAQTLQAKNCGGCTFTPEPGWGLTTMSHI